MITKLNHVSIFVLDQDSAFDFYVNKLGFTVNTDASMGPGKRWLTVNPPEPPSHNAKLTGEFPGWLSSPTRFFAPDETARAR